MIFKTLSLEELKDLCSFDHGCRVGDLSGALYGEDKHEKVFQSLRESIQRNGVTKPLRVVSGVLVDGHHRAMIIMELGLSEIPITYEGRL